LPTSAACRSWPGSSIREAIFRASQPTASEHLKILTRPGLVQSRRIKQWTFYRRDERHIAEVKRAFRSAW